MQSEPGAPPPVFVDQSGRRRRISVLAGTGIGLGLLASLGLIIAGLTTGSSVPLPGWPDAEVQRPAEAGVGELGGTPSAGPGVTGSPAATAPAPGPAPTAVPTAVSVTTRPSPSPTTDQPGQGDLRRTSPTGKPSRSPGKPN